MVNFSDHIKPIHEFSLVFSKGGLGDSIARMPAVKYLLDNAPHIRRVKVYCQKYFIPLAENMLQAYGGRVIFKPYDEMIGDIEGASETVLGSTTDSTHHTTMKSHLTDHAFHTLLDEQPVDKNAYNYLHVSSGKAALPIELPRKYVVVTTGFTARTREWPASEVNTVVSWLRQRGYKVIFLGRTESVFWGDAATTAAFNEQIDYHAGINLIDQTDLLQAHKIMKYAEAVVGVDNGLLHLAACGTVTPIVAGYTTVRAEHRMPYRLGKLGWNVMPILPDKDICQLCQSEMRMVFNHDFRLCYFNTYDCTKDMAADKFIEALKERVCL